MDSTTDCTLPILARRRVLMTARGGTIDPHDDDAMGQYKY
ncbi:hypothetical protein CFAL_10330 [Corynebacterium falsenii DSM 44353]|nr:hypothetical protein CFAL_10330 [Corynebacterium falsenii DSM 44353]